MKRTTQINAQNYKEVARNYRIFRATQLDKNQVGEKKNLLVCPMVEAARSKSAYGQQFLPGLKSTDLEKFADALGVSSTLMKRVAYFSSKWYKIPKNFINESFDDQAINHGVIFNLKNGIHTDIFQNHQFSQDGLNDFVWAIHPDLKGVAMTNDWLYSTEADALYFDTTHLDQVLKYNLSKRPSKTIGLGLKLSTFEMENLLLGVLGQKLSSDDTATRGILIRDIHDLYKYGFVPALVEEKLAAAQLIDLSKNGFE